MAAAESTWAIVAVATAAVIARPWRLPEALWAVGGALALVLGGLLPAHEALAGVRRGTDVYLFLAGMMLMAELARREGLFDWLAGVAARQAKGSGRRLFALVYMVGTGVTVCLSNDATAVVLTPAVFAVTRAVGAPPLPYLLVCAFIANAASFVLPISNPANLVVYGAHLPALPQWLQLFALPSLAAIGLTYGLLRWVLRHDIPLHVKANPPQPRLTQGGRLAALGLGLATLLLAGCAWSGVALGLPTLGAALLTLALLWWGGQHPPGQALRALSWDVLPLVAGLFVFVQALAHTGVVARLAEALAQAGAAWPRAAAPLVGLAVAVLTNAVNNLPAGLLAGSALDAGHVATAVHAATLIGIDLGPNLSVTGSLATILWLAALRREGLHVSAWQFFKLGVLVMPPALLAALLCLAWMA